MINSTSSTTSADTGSWIPGERDKLKPLPDPLTNKSTFLQLFVSQLKNQNPLNPQDGAQFVAQLAQFSQLEQSISMSEDLTAIRKALETTQAGAAATSGSGSK
jgi:flagellar basal-body rod modification protein FlgD